MTLSTTTVRTTYTGSGSSGPFSFPFKITAASDLDVYKTTSAGAVSTLAYPTAYSVTGVGDAAGGSITLTTALAVGESLAIVRDVPTTQPTSLRTQGTFLPESHEDALDRLTMIAQQQDDAIGSAVRLDPSFDPATHSLTLTPETGKVLAWASASALTNVSLDSGATALPGQSRTTSTVTAYLANNAVFNVKDYGALGNGSHDDTSAIQACLTAAGATGSGARIVFPDGNYVVTDTLTITRDRQHLMGYGKYATTITFNPSSAKALFKFRASNTANVLYQCSIRGLGFAGAGTQQKIALDFWDQSECHVEDIAISSSWTGNSSSSSTPSIGIRTSGRELFTVKRVDIFCDRPMHFVRNANAPSLSMDVYHLEDCYLSPLVTTEYAIVIDGDVGLATLNINHQSWVGGTGGLWFKSGTVPATALGVKIANVRYEEPTASGGYAVRWEGTTTGLTLDNVNAGGTGASNGGFYFRNVNKITLANTLYTGTGEALNADATCDDLSLTNAFWQDSGTASTTGLEEVRSVPKIGPAAPLPTTAYYYRTAAAARATKEWGVNVSKKTTTIATGGLYTLVMSASGALKSGRVEAHGYSATGPVRFHGIWHIDATGAALGMDVHTNCAASNTGSKFCTIWNSVGSIQLINNLAQTVTVVISEEWTT